MFISEKFDKQYLLSNANNISWCLPAEVDFEMGNNVAFDQAEKQLPPYLKIHCVKRLESLFVPFSFQRNLKNIIKRMFYEGYRGRNPLSRLNALKFRQTNYLEPVMGEKLFSFAGTLISPSGMGKSSTVQNILRCFQQVVHPNTLRLKVPIEQLVWLNIDCIHDGSLRGLCRQILDNIDVVLGSDYSSLLHNYYPTDNLIMFTARILRIHGLGLLVIDDFQHVLNATEREQAEVLRFIMGLVNAVGIPVLLIGTPKVYKLISEKFCPYVRNNGGGNNLVWNRMKLGEDWNLLVKCKR